MAIQTISDKWKELDQKRNKHTTDLMKILNSNEYQNQGCRYNLQSQKSKRVSSKYLRERSNGRVLTKGHTDVYAIQPAPVVPDKRLRMQDLLRCRGTLYSKGVSKRMF